MKPVIEENAYLGTLPLAHSILSSLDFTQIIERYAPTQPKQEIQNGITTEVVVLNRLCAPIPLYKVESWAQDAGIRFILPVDSQKLNDDRIGRTFDMIAEHIPQAFLDISLNLIMKYSVDITRIQTDGTSIYFEGLYEDNDFIRTGYSHDGHPGKVQVHMFLVTADDGSIPLYYSMHPGNAQDRKVLMPTLKAFIEKYKKVIGNDNLLIIGDRGTITKKNAIRLAKKNFKFLGPLKLDNRLRHILYAIPESKFQKSTYRGRNGTAFWTAEVPIVLRRGSESITVRGIAVLSEAKLKNDINALERVIRTVKNGLQEIAAKIGRVGYHTSSEVRKKVDNLFSRRYKKYQEIFDINIETSGSGRATGLSWRIREDRVVWFKKVAGRYLLVTNDGERIADELLSVYKKRSKSIEWVFRTLKNELHVRPLYLKNLDRIAVLVFLTVVAAMIMLLIRRQYKIAGRKERYWRRLKRIFKSVYVVVLVFEGRRFIVGPEYNAVQLEVFEALGVKPPPLLILE